MISRPGFDLVDTMNGFELMDIKMDTKADKDKLFSPSKSKKSGDIRDSYTDREILAIFNKFLIQEARWLKGNSTISTIYSFQLLVNPEFYNKNEILNAYLQYLLFFEYETLEIIRSWGSVRDDEFAFPSLHEQKSTEESLFGLLELLDKTIAKVYDESDPIKCGICAHLKLRRNLAKSFMLLAYDGNVLKSPEEILKEEHDKILAETEANTKSKNKKKKNKNKKVESL